MKCTNCGADLADSAKFCAECGTKVVREVFCAQCGTKKEWKAVEKGDDWHEGVPAKGVECSDGMVKFGLFG